MQFIYFLHVANGRRVYIINIKYMMGEYYGFGGGGVFMIVFWLIIIWAIISLVRSASGGGHCRRDDYGTKRDGALEILKQRYAKGEISKEDFDKMKNDIQ